MSLSERAGQEAKHGKHSPSRHHDRSGEHGVDRLSKISTKRHAKTWAERASTPAFGGLEYLSRAGGGEMIGEP